jgi:hypothetical protein
MQKGIIEVMTQSQAGIPVANGPRVAHRLCNPIRSNHESSFLTEAHRGVSAAAPERASFRRLCPSGRAISCSLAGRSVFRPFGAELINVVERIADLIEFSVRIDVARRRSSGAQAAAVCRRRVRGVNGIPC